MFRFEMADCRWIDQGTARKLELDGRFNLVIDNYTETVLFHCFGITYQYPLVGKVWFRNDCINFDWEYNGQTIRTVLTCSARALRSKYEVI